MKLCESLPDKDFQNWPKVFVKYEDIVYCYVLVYN